jgi:hypothetical protein
MSYKWTNELVPWVRLFTKRTTIRLQRIQIEDYNNYNPWYEKRMVILSSRYLSTVSAETGTLISWDESFYSLSVKSLSHRFASVSTSSSLWNPWPQRGANWRAALPAMINKSLRHNQTKWRFFGCEIIRLVNFLADRPSYVSSLSSVLYGLFMSPS